jgi:hypothetical protein
MIKTVNKMLDKKSKFQKKAGLMFGGFVLLIFMAFFFGFVVKLLWNWLMPEIFNLPEISYWQAWGLYLLAKVFFGGRRVRKHYHGSGKKYRGKYDRDRIRTKLKKWLDDEDDATTEDPAKE